MPCLSGSSPSMLKGHVRLCQGSLHESVLCIYAQTGRLGSLCNLACTKRQSGGVELTRQDKTRLRCVRRNIHISVCVMGVVDVCATRASEGSSIVSQTRSFKKQQGLYGSKNSKSLVRAHMRKG
jgi:hypothetical protein